MNWVDVSFDEYVYKPSNDDVQYIFERHGIILNHLTEYLCTGTMSIRYSNAYNYWVDEVTMELIDSGSGETIGSINSLKPINDTSRRIIEELNTISHTYLSHIVDDAIDDAYHDR